MKKLPLTTLSARFTKAEYESLVLMASTLGWSLSQLLRYSATRCCREYLDAKTPDERERIAGAMVNV